MQIRIKQLLLLATCSTWLSSIFAADNLPFVEPESVGFSSDQLAKIENHFQGRVNRGEIAGIVTLVARKGKIAHLSAIGYQDVVQNIPMETDTLFSDIFDDKADCIDCSNDALPGWIFSTHRPTF